MEEVDAAQAQELLRAGAALLDCRYDFEYDESHIPGARLAPLDRLRTQGVFSLEAGRTHVVYCRSGRRSKAAAFLLRWQGRLWLCSCGSFRPWLGDAWGSETSQQLFDPYSFTHVLHGFALAGLLALLLPRAGWRQRQPISAA